MELAIEIFDLYCISFLLSASLISQEASLSRADNIKIFNEASIDAIKEAMQRID